MRRLTQDELRAFGINLNNQVANILNVAQVKTILRLMRDEVGEDKDLLEYVNLALNQQILDSLKLCIPKPTVIRLGKSVWDVAQTTDDWFIKYLATKDDWLYEYRAAGNVILRLSECEVVMPTVPTGVDVSWGIQDKRYGLWICENRKNVRQVYCSTCSWMEVTKEKKSFVCQICKNDLLRCVENEPNNLR